MSTVPYKILPLSSKTVKNETVTTHNLYHDGQNFHQIQAISESKHQLNYCSFLLIQNSSKTTKKIFTFDVSTSIRGLHTVYLCSKT